MKVQDKSRQEPPFDIPSGAWAMYQAQGYHQILEVKKAEPLVTVSWSVQRGRFIGDYECPPIITFSATNGTKGFCESQIGTAHKNVKVYIVGQRPHTCPEHVAHEYIRLFNEWAAKSKKGRKPPAEKVSASTPKVPGVTPWTGATTSPWRGNVETRNK